MTASGSAGATLRAMSWRDIESVHDLETALFPVDAWSVEQFWGELAQPTRSYLVAEREGAIVGYGGIMAIPPTADLQTIAVAEREHGRGTGTSMLEALIGLAVDAGCAEMLLEVRSDNAPALALYSRRGFERIALRRDYYAPGIDALVMRLRPLAAREAGS